MVLYLTQGKVDVLPVQYQHPIGNGHGDQHILVTKWVDARGSGHSNNFSSFRPLSASWLPKKTITSAFFSYLLSSPVIAE